MTAARLPLLLQLTGRVFYRDASGGVIEKPLFDWSSKFNSQRDQPVRASKVKPFISLAA